MLTIKKTHWSLLITFFIFTSLGWWGHAALYEVTDNNSAASSPNNTIVSETEGNFTATAIYQGDDEWNYTVQGNYANQCPDHDLSIETTPTDPTTVTVRLVTYRPFDESICAQRIKAINETGTFTANEEMELVFISDEKFSSSSPTGLEPNTTL